LDAVNNQESLQEERQEHDTIGYWLKWIKAAKKAADRHWQDSKAAWNEYKNESKRSNTSDSTDTMVGLVYPIYWSSCKTIEPAYYSRTPKLSTRRRFGISDDISNLGSLIIERIGEWCVENCEFDSTLMESVKDFIHADKATLQAVFEADLIDVADNQPLTMLPPAMPDPMAMMAPEQVNSVSADLMIPDNNPQPQYAMADGTPHDGEVLQNPDGSYYAPMTRQEARNPRIYLAPVCYDEILHTPDAKSEAEIKDKAYYFSMTKDEALERFTQLQGQSVSWKKKTGDGEDKSMSMPGEYLEGWEIWCSKAKKVYWVSEQYSQEFLDVKEDPYRLRKFFPSPSFIIGSKPNKSMYPTNAYQHLAPTLMQLHQAYQKVFNLIQAIRRRALVDNSEPELIEALNSLSDLEFVGCKNLQSIVEKGGISNVIYYLPVQELVQAIGELNDLEERFKNNFSEWFGVPDILRGVSDPIETAEAQGIKSGAAQDRFKYQKKQVGQLARDAIEMMVDMVLGLFDVPKIMDIVGYSFMTDKQKTDFPIALALVQNDEERLIRIEIDTDSMAFIDQTIRQNHRNVAVQTVINGLKEVSGMLQIDPDFARAALKTVLASLDGMEGGKEFADDVKGAVEALMNSKQTAQLPPPPPDYEGMKIQLQDQQAQMANQLKSRQLDQQEWQMQLDEKDRDFQRQVEEVRVGFEARNVALEEKLEQFNEIIQAQTLSIESFKAQMNAQESAAEESRLAQEAQIMALKETTAPAEPQIAPPPVIVQAPPVTIHNYPAPNSTQGPMTKITNIKRDPLTGDSQAVTTEVPITPTIPMLPTGL